MNDVLRALVEAWEKRAETYRRLGEDEAARHVEMCVWELEIWLEATEERTNANVYGVEDDD